MRLSTGRNICSTIFKTIQDLTTGKTKITSSGFLGDVFSGDFFKPQSIISESDFEDLTRFNEAIKDGTPYLTAIKQEMGNSSETAKNLAKSAKGAAVNMDAIPKVSKAATAGMKALAVAGNMLVSMGISLAISAIVSGIQKLANAQEDAIAKADEFIAKFNEQRTSLTNNKNAIDSMSEDYEELSKGVDSLGRNISLNSAEYTRYNEIVNQIADMFPQMIQGYTDEGNAIIAHKGNVEELTKAYEEQKKAAQDAIIVGSADVFKGFKAKVDKDANASWEETGLIQLKSLGGYLTSIINDQEKVEEFLGNLSNSNYDYNYVQLKDLLTNAGYEVSWNNDYDKALEDVKTDPQKLRSYLSTISTTIEAEVVKIKPIMQAYLEQSYGYQGLDKDVQDIVKQIVGQFDSEFYAQFNNETEMASWVTKNIVNKFKGKNGEKMASEFQMMLGIQTQFNNDEITVSDYQEKLATFLEVIESLPDKTEKYIKLLFGISSDGENSDVDTMIANVEKKLKGKFKDEIGDLKLGDLEILSGLDISPEGIEDWSEVETLIANAKKTTDEMTVSLESFNKEMDKIQEGYDAVQSAIDEYNEQGYLSVDATQKLLALDDELLATMVDEEGQVDLNTLAFEDLARAKLENLRASATEALTSWISKLEEEGVTADELAAKYINVANAKNLASGEVPTGYKDKDGNWVDVTDTPEYKSYLTRQKAIDDAIAGIGKGGLSSDSSNKSKKDLAKEKAKKEQEYAEKVMDIQEELADARADYAEKVADINADLAEKEEQFAEDMAEAWEKEHLEQLKDSLEERKDIINRYKEAIDVSDFGLDLLDETNFGGKSDLLTQKLDQLTSYGVEMRKEFERVASIIPQTGEEAQELANRLTELGDDMRSNVTAIRETKMAIQQLRIDAFTSIAEDGLGQLEAELDNIDKRLEILNADDEDDFKYTNKFLNMQSLLPTMSNFDKELSEKRRTDMALISQEQSTQNKINSIVTKALEQQAKDNAAAREKERQNLIKDMEKARRDAAKKLAEAQKDLQNAIKEAGKKLQEANEDYKEFLEENKLETDETIDYVEKAIKDAGLDFPKPDISKVKTAVDDIVKMVNGIEGTVDINVNVNKNETVPRGQGVASGSGNSSVVEAAKKQLGVPYVYGGESLEEGGFDCSGLVQWAYAQVGKSIPRVTYDQWKGGTPVDKNSLLPGDLVFFNMGTKGPEHVAMFVSGDQIIHSPKPGRTVTYEKLSNMKDYVGARRYARGTNFHPGGIAMVGDENWLKGWSKPAPELAIYPDGSSEIVGEDGVELRDLPRGTQVIPAKKTKELLNKIGIPNYATGANTPEEIAKWPWLEAMYLYDGDLLYDAYGDDNTRYKTREDFLKEIKLVREGLENDDSERTLEDILWTAENLLKTIEKQAFDVHYEAKEVLDSGHGQIYRPGQFDYTSEPQLYNYFHNELSPAYLEALSLKQDVTRSMMYRDYSWLNQYREAKLAYDSAEERAGTAVPKIYTDEALAERDNVITNLEKDFGADWRKYSIKIEDDSTGTYQMFGLDRYLQDSKIGGIKWNHAIEIINIAKESGSNTALDRVYTPIDYEYIRKGSLSEPKAGDEIQLPYAWAGVEEDVVDRNYQFIPHDVIYYSGMYGGRPEGVADEYMNAAVNKSNAAFAAVVSQLPWADQLIALYDFVRANDLGSADRVIFNQIAEIIHPAIRAVQDMGEIWNKIETGQYLNKEELDGLYQQFEDKKNQFENEIKPSTIEKLEAITPIEEMPYYTENDLGIYSPFLRGIKHENILGVDSLPEWVKDSQSDLDVNGFGHILIDSNGKVLANLHDPQDLTKVLKRLNDQGFEILGWDFEHNKPIEESGWIGTEESKQWYDAENKYVWQKGFFGAERYNIDNPSEIIRMSVNDANLEAPENFLEAWDEKVGSQINLDWGRAAELVLSGGPLSGFSQYLPSTNTNVSNNNSGDKPEYSDPELENIDNFMKEFTSRTNAIVSDSRVEQEKINKREGKYAGLSDDEVYEELYKLAKQVNDDGLAVLDDLNTRVYKAYAAYQELFKNNPEDMNPEVIAGYEGLIKTLSNQAYSSESSMVERRERAKNRIVSRADEEIADIQHEMELALKNNPDIDTTEFYERIQKIREETAKTLREFDGGAGAELFKEDIKKYSLGWWDDQDAIEDFKRKALEKSISDIEEYIDARNHFNDWDAYGDSELKAVQRITKIIQDEYDQRLISFEEYIDKLEEQTQRVYSLAQNEIEKNLSNIDKYIDARNHFNDWDEFGDSEIDAINRQIQYLDAAYEHNLISYEEYAEKVAEYTQKIYSVAKDNITEEISKLVEDYEEMKQFETSQLESQKTLLQSYHDVINAIVDAQHEINKELKASMTMHEYLNEETRELLFNQEDYNALNEELLEIQSSADELRKQYQQDILDADAETIAEITEQYQMQYATLMKQYEIAKAELEVAKKRQKLDNVLAERNVRMFINGQWQWVANTQDVINAQNELADAEINKEKEEASLEQTEAINDLTKQVNSIETDLNKVRKWWSDMQELLDGESEEVAKALKEISKVSSPELKEIITATGGSVKSFSVSLGESVGAISDIINGDPTSTTPSISSIIADLGDYSDAIQELIAEINNTKLEESNSGKKSTGDIIAEMKANSEAWHTASDYEKGRLEEKNQELGASIGATFDSETGEWYDSKGKPLYGGSSSSSSGGSSSSGRTYTTANGKTAISKTGSTSPSSGGSSSTYDSTATKSDGTTVNITIDSSGNTLNKGLSAGTVVHTSGGDYKIVTSGTEGAKYNPNSGYWSIKVNADGSRYTSSGLNLMGEEGFEAFITNNGRLIPITQPTIGNIGAGGIVFNREQMANLRNLWDLSNLGRVSPFVSASNANSQSTTIDNSIHINGMSISEKGNEDWINGLRRYVATHK